MTGMLLMPTIPAQTRESDSVLPAIEDMDYSAEFKTEPSILAVTSTAGMILS